MLIDGQPNEGELPPETSSQAVDLSDGAENAAPPAAAAPPTLDPAAAARAQKAFVKMASARTEDELRAAQAELRQLAGWADPSAPPPPRDYAREATERRMKLVNRMPGENDEQKTEAFANYDELADYVLAKHAASIEELADKRASSRFASMLDELGITPDDLRGLKGMRDNAVWAPVLEKHPQLKGALPKAKEVMAKAARLGEELEPEEALMFAARSIGKSTTAAPNQTKRPPVPTAEAGPAPRQERPEVQRPMTREELIADFERSQSKLQERFSHLGLGFKNGR